MCASAPESRVIPADPVELARLPYQAAVSNARQARRHPATADIAARLAQLYDSVPRRPLDANFEQADPPLAEVLGPLTTLSEAWDGAHQSPKRPSPTSIRGPWPRNQTPHRTLPPMVGAARGLPRGDCGFCGIHIPGFRRQNAIRTPGRTRQWRSDS
jgi:hypothetical protein